MNNSWFRYLFLQYEVLDYRKANIENISKSISNFNWTRAFENLSVDKKVELFKETSLNIYRNYIPNNKNVTIVSVHEWLVTLQNRRLQNTRPRPKLTKIFYKNGQTKTDREKELKKATGCTKEILEAKKNYIFKLSRKLEVIILLQKHIRL